MSYFLTSLFRLGITMVGIFALTFLVMLSVPGNPVFSRYEKGLTQEQLLAKSKEVKQGVGNKFFVYLKKILSFDFGVSMVTGEQINQELYKRVKGTLYLSALAALVFVVLGVGFGLIGALFEGRWPDIALKIITTGFISTPVFWFGLMLALLFSVWLGMLPVTWNGSFSSMVLPALTVGLRPAALLQRMTQSSVREILIKPYITVAMAKGLSFPRVLFFHVLKNASAPVLGVVSAELGTLLTGAVVAELIFSYKGLGEYILIGIQNRDYPILMASVFISCLMVSLLNFFIELLQYVLDPRLKSEAA